MTFKIFFIVFLFRSLPPRNYEAKFDCRVRKRMLRFLDHIR